MKKTLWITSGIIIFILVIFSLAIFTTNIFEKRYQSLNSYKYVDNTYDQETAILRNDCPSFTDESPLSGGHFLYFYDEYDCKSMRNSCGLKGHIVQSLPSACSVVKSKGDYEGYYFFMVEGLVN